MTDAAPPTVRLAHFSDIHITAKSLGWSRADFISKRLTGWMNLRLLGRGFRFRRAAAVAATLKKELLEERFDHLVFSGDASTMGFEAEFAEAARCMGVGEGGVPPGITTPGNHDYYTRACVTLGLFEKHFAPWLTGERVGDHAYPLAQKVGHLWLVSVCSSTHNRMSWDASGAVGPEQLGRLRELLARLGPGPRVVVTHYPLCKSNGRAEPRWHRLRDWRETADVMVEGGVGLWLHGHRHEGYHVLPPLSPFPVVCAGSATQSNRWTYCRYAIDGWKVRAKRRVYSLRQSQFIDGEEFEFEMGGGRG